MPVQTVSEYYKLDLSEPFKTARGTKYRFIQNGRYYDKAGIRMCGDDEMLVTPKGPRRSSYSTPTFIAEVIRRQNRSLEDVDIIPYKDGYAYICKKDS